MKDDHDSKAVDAILKDSPEWNNKWTAGYVTALERVAEAASRLYEGEGKTEFKPGWAEASALRHALADLSLHLPL